MFLKLWSKVLHALSDLISTWARFSRKRALWALTPPLRLGIQSFAYLTSDLIPTFAKHFKLNMARSHFVREMKMSVLQSCVHVRIKSSFWASKLWRPSLMSDLSPTYGLKSVIRLGLQSSEAPLG